MPTVFGITGLMGSGKNVLAHLFFLKGWHVIDVDSVGKEILQSKQTIHDLSKLFGSQILDSNGKIVPSSLGEIVFHHDAELNKLNEYMHPKMKNQIIQIIQQSPNKKIVLHAALLFQMELDSLCHLIIQIRVYKELLIQRILERKTYLTPEILKKLLEKQKKDNHFFKPSDIVIDNSLDQIELQRKFERLYAQLKEDIHE